MRKKGGFSYLGEDKLDMRMDQSQKLSAYEVVNNYKEEDLANIILNMEKKDLQKRLQKVYA